MNDSHVPGQVVLHLTATQLVRLFQALQLSLNQSGWLRALLWVGENQALCQQLEQIWQEAAHQTRYTVEPPLRKGAIASAVPSAPELTPETALPWSDAPGMPAGLLVLSSALNLCLHIEDLEPEAAWVVQLQLTPQAILQVLRLPSVAQALPHCIDLQVTDFCQNSRILRQFWAQLLPLSLKQPDAELLSPALDHPLDPLVPESPAWVTVAAEPEEVDSEPSLAAPPTALVDLLQEAPIGVLSESLDGGILSANTTFCELIGYTEAQLRHLDRRTISHPEDFATELKLIQPILTGQVAQKRLKKRFLRRNGDTVWTEVVISLVGQPDAEESYLLTFVTDLSDRQRANQEIQQRREREALLSEISAQIRSTLDLPTILQVVMKRLRQSLDTDRVLAYQLKSDASGICVAEAVNPIYPALIEQTYTTECIPPPYLEAYRLGRVWSINDVNSAELTDCHREILHQIQVRSMVAVAIQRADEMLEPYKRTLWGLLVVHHCRAPRCWTPDEEQLVQAIANQLAIALEQASLIQQLQAYTHELENRVQQRTRSLERSLQFEQLIRHLTETLRKALDEDQVLQAAVEGLSQILGLQGCYAGLFNAAQDFVEVRYAHLYEKSAHPQPDLVGQSFPLTSWPDCCQADLSAGRSCLQRVSVPKAITAQELVQVLTGSLVLPLPECLEERIDLVQWVSPIVDDQGLIGILAVFGWEESLPLVPGHPEPAPQSVCYFSNIEPAAVKLIEQVASQCAIAIRQARLYRQEHAARISAAHFRSFLEQSKDIFVEYDAQCRYISINASGSALMGITAETVIGKTNRELIGDFAESIEAPLRQAIATGRPVFINHEIPLVSGPKIFETIYTPIADLTGTVQRVIGICRDITEFKQQWHLLETQNHQLAATTRLKEEFIANTSHELRTPLTAILGFSNVLLQGFFGELNSKQKDYMERIHSSGQHLLALINDILDLSRLEADRLELEPQLIFIHDLCESVTSLIQEQVDEQGLSLEIEVEANLDYVVADPRRLRQMLLNLLMNAVKFTPAGRVGLKIYRSPSLEGNPGEKIHFEVWDTGVGIDTAEQHLLFAPFSQLDTSIARQNQGTGLGLVITRKLAELHGGSITLESQAGQGARFILTLPLQSVAPTFMTDPSLGASFNLPTFTRLMSQEGISHN